MPWARCRHEYDPDAAFWQEAATPPTRACAHSGDTRSWREEAEAEMGELA